MKKVISIMMISVFLCGLTLNTSAKNGFDNKNSDKANELVNKGFPQSVVETLDESSIDRIYQKIATEGVTYITSNQETYFIEFLSDGDEGVSAREAISSSQLRIVANTMNFADSSGKITGCDVSLVYDWLITPGVCDTDAITVGWDPGVLTYSGYMNGYNKVKNIGSGGEDYYNFISGASLANTGGIGWYAELRSPNISSKIQSNPGGSAYISFIPAKTFYANSGITSNFQIQYTHNKVGLSIGLSYGAIGVSVDCFGGTDTASKSLVYYASEVNN